MEHNYRKLTLGINTGEIKRLTLGVDTGEIKKHTLGIDKICHDLK